VIFAIILVLVLGNLTNNISVESKKNEIDRVMRFQTNIVCAVMTDMPKKPGTEVIRPYLMDAINSDLIRDDLPDYFNWQNHQGSDWTTSVKYQGACGSCWAFTACAMMEAKINILSNNPDLDIDLSEQYILSCLGLAGSCYGGWVYSALFYIEDESYWGNSVNGIVTEDCFNYLASDDIDCVEKCENWQETLWRIQNYGTYVTTGNKDLVKQTLIDKGPLGVNFLATDDFIDWGLANHDQNDYYPYSGYVSAVNHAVTLIGYRDDPSIPNGGYWICKNSWGQDFGYEGFFNIEYGALGIDKEVTWVDVVSDNLLLVDFEYNPKEINTNQIVNFIGSSNKEIASWWWDFGDGYFSNLKSPIHTYYREGSFNAILTINSVSGEVKSISKEINVGENSIIADFEYSPEAPSVLEDIQFLDKSSGVEILEWYWDFGDGTVSSVKNPVHSYSDNGIYQVTLKVTGSYSTDSISRDIEVSCRKPIADFTFSINGNEVTFTDLSNDVDGDIISWRWDFGDGETSFDQNPSHLFESAGSYDVVLTVIDDDGENSLKTKNILIGAKADFSFSPIEPSVEDIIYFSDQSSNSISWDWDFGDGNSSNEKNPSHRYTLPGDYDVSLTIIDDYSQIDYIIKTINVLPANVPPDASFIFSPFEPGVEDEVTFSDTSFDSDGTIVEWFWNFGDGTTSTLQNPKHKYSEAGSFDVLLTISDNDGGIDSYSESITISEVLEYLDLEQSKWGYPSTKIYGSTQGAQSFVPSVEKITKIQLYIIRIDKNDNLNGEITLSVKKSLKESDLSSASYSLKDIPKNLEWIEFDIPDIDTEPGSMYYIVLKTNSNSENEYLQWAKGVYTGYNEGGYYLTNNNWRNSRYFYSYDFCFKIFGIYQ